MANIILPGVYVTVRDEGLISVSGVSVGTVGIVGTANGGETNKSYILSSFIEAKETFGTPQSDIDEAQAEVDSAQAALDAAASAEKTSKQMTLNEKQAILDELIDNRYQCNLLEALELIFANGGRSVCAIRSGDATPTSYQTALATLENEIVNIVTVAGEDATNTDVMAHLKAHLNTTSGIQRERIAVAGSGVDTDIDSIIDSKDNVVDNTGRLVYVAPGVTTTSGDSRSGADMAAAVTGLIASLPVRTSPTNKTLTFIGQLAANYNFGQLEGLVSANVLTVEKREGFRVVRGVTTSSNTAWTQITTRRIVDKAVYGVRSACNPYIGKLNNTRVRGAMKATIDGFLTRMVEEESLVAYTLEVTATRTQEINGTAAVTMSIQPTFSIDYIQVTMTLG
jgi:hypothetical protein